MKRSVGFFILVALGALAGCSSGKEIASAPTSPPVTNPPVQVRPEDETATCCGLPVDKSRPGVEETLPLAPVQLKPPPEAEAEPARANPAGTNNAAAMANRPRMRIPNPL